ncbi:hypothetical protein FD755_000874 [Muntiacus reevesi]|uniref:Calcium load-activated calcium channel n=1 Tax=Muntiacus reevesi TaxID=9886 RepID=A0A5J5MZN2_MUNRE|nr:hypothetical protein FD755_000874 [Muntiacus reevesi]
MSTSGAAPRKRKKIVFASLSLAVKGFPRGEWECRVKREMSTMFADTLLIVFISVCTALLAEGITWVLVYRTDKYKRLKAEVEKQSKKLEKKKETITESAGRQQKKKIERQEEKLKNNNRDLFDGRVVAKLPFTPLSYIQGLSHRNLLGDDTTDCSFIFLYILCTMSIRQVKSSQVSSLLRLSKSRKAEWILPSHYHFFFIIHHCLLALQEHK